VDVDLDKLTRALAARMAAIVPAGFYVEAGDGMLWYSAEEGRFPGQAGGYRVGRSGTFVRINFEGYGQPGEDALAEVAAQALGELQDYVDEATHDPWPGRSRPPRPYAQVHEKVLHLWYGGAELNDAVVLACDPIPLADLRSV
jgi:hypothetical protein